MAHCSVCSSLCPELDVPFTFQCTTCDFWFERPHLAKAVNKVSGESGDRVAQVRKRAKESRMITAEDVSIKGKNLVRNLTPHVHASKELALPSLNGMLSNEWWHFLTGNEQLALCVRDNMYTLAKKVSERSALASAQEGRANRSQVGTGTNTPERLEQRCNF